MPDASLTVFALAGVLGVALVVTRWQLARSESASRRTYELTFPADFSEQSAVAVVRGLAGLLRPWWRRILSQPAIVLEVHADRRGIRHLLRVPAAVAPYICSQLWASGVRLSEVEDGAPRMGLAAELRRGDVASPLTTDDPGALAAGMLAALQPLRAGETVCWQWVITAGRAALPSELQSRNGSWRALLLGERDPTPIVADVRAWRREPAFLAAVRMGVRAERLPRARQLLGQLSASLQRSRGGEATFHRRALPSVLITDRIRRGAVPVLDYPCLLRADELSALLLMPLGDPVLPGLTIGAARQLAPSSSVPTRGRIVGWATFPGATRALALSPEASLRHLHVIGPTGVGKSTLLLSLICQDMAAGGGVCVIDPKGDLAADVLARVPAGRERDVIVFDPSDAERPVGFNILGGLEREPELIADQTVALFRGLYAAFWGPRTDDILRAAILTLAHTPGMTLAEVPALLTDGGFRRRLLGRVDDHVLEGFWGWYEGLSAGERTQAIGPVLNKVRTFLLRRRVRAVIGQADSGFALPAVVAEQKILIASLPKGVLGEDAARLLGSALLASLWNAVQARAALPTGERRPFFCHVDEFQDYAALPTSFADLLAQARGYGFSLTLAHQHLGQVPAALREAVLANARSKIVFQTTASDARVLARELAPFVTPADLLGLAPFEAYAALATGPRVAAPASLATRPAPPETGRGAAARAHSRRTYGRPRQDVEAAIRARSEGVSDPALVGRRRRP
jgi:TraM recognition site of TraD and TraG/Type IV secretory system Conjugative DNA transfer